MQRWRRWGVGAAVVVALLGATASPAAATTITSPYLTCDSGGSEVICWFSWNGGTGPFTIRWLYNGQPWSESDDASALRHTCWANHNYTVKVTVTDVHGHTASVQGECFCNPGDWG
jgi:hypothetical protein